MDLEDYNRTAPKYGEIHPRDKLGVGARLALAAQAVAYGDAGAVYSGPVFSGCKQEECGQECFLELIFDAALLRGEKVWAAGTGD